MIGLTLVSSDDVNRSLNFYSDFTTNLDLKQHEYTLTLYCRCIDFMLPLNITYFHLDNMQSQNMYFKFK